MKVTTEPLEHRQVRVTVELDEAEVDERMRQTAREISRRFNVPGYRRGKAPYHVVLRSFGREAIRQEMLDQFGQELYDAALEQIEYKPYRAGELKEVQWDPFRMEIILPIEPEVVLGDYWAIRRPLEIEPVTDEQVEEALRGIQTEHAQWVPVERPAAFGDQVVLDLGAEIGSQRVEKEEQYELHLEEGASQPVPGFHEQIVGLSAGETKTFQLAYPKDHANREAAGREATFTVRLHVVKQKELPPLDDDLAMMVGDYDTLDDLRAAIRRQLEEEALERAKPGYVDGMLEAMVEQAVKIDYPPQALEQEVERSLGRIERNLARSGLRLDRFLLQTGQTRESYGASLRPAAEVRLKKQLVMAEVARQEGIKVTEEEIDAELARLKAMVGDENEELRRMLDSPEARLSVADDLLSDRVQERIFEIGRAAPRTVWTPASPPVGEGEPGEEAGAGPPSGVEPQTPVESGAETAAEEPLAEGD